MANEWNLLTPSDDELVSDLPGEHRERKTNVAAVLEKEHATLGDSNSGGEHKQGSAIAWYLATGDIPALDVEDNALAETDNGRLWLDSTTKIFYALDDYSDPTVAGGWLAMGHLLGDIAINTNKFTVARATGNTLVAGTLAVTGTLGVTGVATIAKGSLLASSDAPTTDAMIVNKKFVNDQIATVVFGVWNDRTDSGSGDTVSNNTEYTAITDGIVMAYKNTGGTAAELIGFTPTATQRVRATFGGPGGSDVINITYPVRNGDTWKVTGATTVFWLPQGNQ